MAHHITKQKLKYYKFFQRRGDVEKLASSCKVEKGTIYVALSTGRCSPELAENIDKFYAQRYKEFKKVIDASQDN